MDEKNILSSKSVKDFIDFLETGKKVWSEDTLILKEYNDKQNDLLHDLEIPEKMLSKDILSLGRQIRDLRKQRRMIKDELTVANVVTEFLTKHPTFIDDLKFLQENIEKQEEYIGDRSYTIRSVLPSQTCEENKSDDNKMILLVKKHLKKWSHNNYELITDLKIDETSGIKYNIINFSTTNMTYDIIGAKNAFTNLKRILEKDIINIFPGSILEGFQIADSSIRCMDIKGAARITALYVIKVSDGEKYTLNGTIAFRDTNTTPKKGKKKK